MQRILGQQSAVRQLQRALASQRMHHAWIFSGPRGVGKFTAAVELAKILLDPQAGPNLAGEIEADPDGPIAQKVDARTHPDLHLIRKELARYSDNQGLVDRKLMNIPLDLMRELLLGGQTSDGRMREAPAYRTPMLGHAKVFIIDEAELLDEASQNAMLKTLEEPPRATYLFLITSRPERLLNTVHSRCQHVRFARLDDESLHTWMQQAELTDDPQQRAWIERFCDGSPGVAEIAAAYGFHRWHLQLAPMLRELDEGRFSVELGPTLGALADDFATEWVKRHDNASKESANRDGVRFLIALLAAHARDGLLRSVQEGGDPSYWASVIDALREVESLAEGKVNMKQALELLPVRWSRLCAAG